MEIRITTRVGCEPNYRADTTIPAEDDLAAQLEEIINDCVSSNLNDYPIHHEISIENIKFIAEIDSIFSSTYLGLEIFDDDERIYIANYENNQTDKEWNINSTAGNMAYEIEDRLYKLVRRKI